MVFEKSFCAIIIFSVNCNVNIDPGQLQDFRKVNIRKLIKGIIRYQKAMWELILERWRKLLRADETLFKINKLATNNFDSCLLSWFSCCTINGSPFILNGYKLSRDILMLLPAAPSSVGWTQLHVLEVG